MDLTTRKRFDFYVRVNTKTVGMMMINIDEHSPSYRYYR